MVSRGRAQPCRAGGERVAADVCPRRLTRLFRLLAEFSGVLHHCHILASEMVHFIHQMQYYITFEVPGAPLLPVETRRVFVWRTLLGMQDGEDTPYP